MQEFAQHTKIQLMKFNPCHVPRDLGYVVLGNTLGWQVNNGAGYVAGTTVIAIDAGAVAPVAGSVVKFAGHDWAYKVASGTTTSVTLSDGLKQAVIDNEIITAYTVYDVTEHLKAVSDYEIVTNPTTSDIILDAQMDFVFSNLEVQQGLAAETYPFYLRDTFTPYHKFGLPYLSTLISEDWWVRIALLNVADWETFYVGKVVKDSVDVRYPDLDVVFFTESPLYALRDIEFGDVDGVYDGHAYTDADNLSTTISGDLKTIIKKTMVSGISDTSNAAFDSDSDFFDHTHQGTAYDFSDVWWINDLWTDVDIAGLSAWDWLKQQCVRWNANVVLNFESNVPKLYFRSKTNSSAAIDTLVADDLLDRAVISPQWNEKIDGGVVVKSNVMYWNGTSKSSIVSYDGNNAAAIVNIASLNVKGSDEIAINENDALENDDRFIVDEGDTYKKLGMSGINTQIRPVAQKGMKAFEAVYKSDAPVTNIDNTQSVKIKLVYPDIYVVGDDGTGWRLYNNGTIGNYSKELLTPVSPGTSDSGIAVVDPIPIGTLGEIPCGKAMFYSENTSESILSRPTAIEAQSRNRRIELADESTVARGMTAGYVYRYTLDSVTVDPNVIPKIEWQLLLLYARSSGGVAYWIDLQDHGDVSVDTYAYGYRNDMFGYYTLETVDNVRYDLTAFGNLFLNANALNPWRDQYVYCASIISDGFLEYQNLDDLAFILYPVFTSGTAPSGSAWQGLHVAPRSSSTNGQYFWITDTSNKCVVFGYGNSYASVTIIAGGGASAYAAKGASEVATDILMSSPLGVWKCYDDLVVFTDADEDVVCLIDLSSGDCWTIEDTIGYPSQVCAEDFTSVYKYNNGGADQWVDFNANTAKLLWNFISVDRRVVKCMVHKDTMTTKPKPLDRLILNEDVIAPISVTTGTYAWIIGMTYNFERREYGFKLLEDQAA